MANLFTVKGGTLLAAFILCSVFCLAMSDGRRPVPLSLLKEISKMKSVQEILNKYSTPRDKVVRPGAKDDLGNDNTETGSIQEEPSPLRSLEPETSVTSCFPHNVSVDIPPHPDPSIIRFPFCTMLPRCGGCCGHAKTFACLAVTVQSVPITVTKLVFNGTTHDSTMTEVVQMESHSTCDCMCRTQATDCNPAKHIYNSDMCSCNCKNEDQATSCPSSKRWDKELCACVCPTLLNCLEDEVFSFRTCSCDRQTLQAAMPGNVNCSDSNRTRSLEECERSMTCRPRFKAVLLMSGSCACRPIR